MAHLLLTDLADPKTNISLEKNGLKPQFCIFYELVKDLPILCIVILNTDDKYWTQPLSLPE